MNKKDYSNKELLNTLLPYIGRYKKIFFADLVFAAMTTASEMVLPMILSTITDTASSNFADLTMGFIAKMTLIYVIFRIVEIIGSYYMQSVGHIMGAKIERDMRSDLFKHIQSQSMEFFSENKVGSLMSRLTSDLMDITEFSHHGPEEAFIAIIKISISFVILINIDVPLTLIVFVILPIMAIFSKSARRRMRKSQREQRSKMGNLNSDIEDSLLGIDVVQSYANEDLESEKFEEENNSYTKIKEQYYYAMADFNMTNRVFDALMFILVISIGGYSLIKGRITPGNFIAFIFYIQTLLATVKRIVEFSDSFERGMSGIERFKQIMAIETTIEEKEDAIELKNVKGEIEFSNVDFSYPGYDDIVIDKLNLLVKPGESIAIVGPSGAGKTTISKLIPRFYDVDSGKITIDGLDIKDLTIESLRTNIGIVQQDVYLFSGNIYENIEYGRPGASNEDIIEAAKLANAYDFIMDLPYGFETYVGERGVKLSGGQKQRISIARAFLKNPKVLILDEATSALDNKSEKEVQKSLNKLSKGRTTITIAHRLSTIINSDKIYVLTDLGIVESGSHEELIGLKGEYFNLYQALENMN